MAFIHTQYAIFLSILLTTIFFFNVNSTEIETTSFSIPKFSSHQKNIELFGDAYTKDGKLILNEAKSNTVGQALYTAPIHIFDSKTGKVADFTTSFTFFRNASNSYNLADSILFFIDTKPRGNGIKTALTITVKFDTHFSIPLIQIYVNGNEIASETFNLQEPNKITISFNGFTAKLTVNLNDRNSRTTWVPLEFSHEWVSIGLLGGTEIEAVAHEIHSWSFKSELDVSFKQLAYA